MPKRKLFPDFGLNTRLFTIGLQKTIQMPEGALGLLCKGKEIIGAKIPQHYNSGCDSFCNVKTDFFALIKKVNQCIVHAQTNEGDKEEFGKLNADCGVVAVKCPNTVQYVIAYHSAQKPNAIGDIFIQPDLFF